MKPLIFSLFTLFVFGLSCSSSRVESIRNNPCYIRLDSIGQLLNQEKNGLYSVDWNAINVDKYESLSEVEKMARGIPLDEKFHKLYALNLSLNLLNKLENCQNSIDRKTIIRLIGVPTVIAHDGSFLYKFNFGIDCSCETCPPNRKYDGCEYFFIFFDESGRLSRLACQL